MKIGTNVFAALALAAIGTANAADLENLSNPERNAFRSEVRAYLLENPKVILEVLDILQEQRAVEEAETTRERIEAFSDNIFNDAHSWVGGNLDGDISLVEFLDYRCGYCRRAFEDVEALVAEDGNIRFVIKEFPILGENSLNSALFALSVLNLEGPDAYKAVHDFLISYEGLVDDQFIRKYSRERKFDPSAIMKEMGSERVRGAVEANRELAAFLEISGTPGFIVGNTLIGGWPGRSGLAKAITKARSLTQ